jgi:hypothetical protein
VISKKNPALPVIKFDFDKARKNSVKNISKTNTRARSFGGTEEFKVLKQSQESELNKSSEEKNLEAEKDSKTSPQTKPKPFQRLEQLKESSNKNTSSNQSSQEPYFQTNENLENIEEKKPNILVRIIKFIWTPFYFIFLVIKEIIGIISHLFKKRY